MKILAHIVGLTNKYKLKLLSDIKPYLTRYKSEIIIIDLDEITKECINDEYLISLDTKIDNLRNQKQKFKRVLCKTINKEIKDIEILIATFWKNKLETSINNVNNININNNKHIILIGKSTFYNNHNININIETSNKLFFKINLTDYSKEIIIYNLDTYRDDIINGKFDLNYIQMDFIIKERQIIQDNYKNLGYVLKNYNDIFKLLQLFIYQIDNPHKLDGLFFVSSKELSKSDIKKQKNIIGYTTLWLAIISSIKTGIIKGYCNNIPYIKEFKNNCLTMLNKPLFVYYTIDMHCFMPELTNTSQIYKYISTNTLINISSKCLENPLYMLKKMKINIINYNNISIN